MRELRFFITQREVNLYARTSGDYNPIHLDEEQAKNHGFTGTIAHGMLMMAKVWSELSKHFLDLTDFPSRYELQFPSPVYVNDLIVLQVEKKGRQLHVKGMCQERVVVKGFVEMNKGDYAEYLSELLEAGDEQNL